MTQRVLSVIDRAYRGAVEAQFFDAMYGLLDLHAQFDQVDLALRGPAVTMAVDDDTYRPSLELGGLRIDTLPDYRRSVRDLVADGIGVLVDESALRELGFPAERLVPGVTGLDPAALARRWPDYDQVWFL
ncbi:hypothetical protein [Amycolatopsis sp. H20-H5]|uniref:hypothetical protein n=1 Tax=Amycolatopsis sp. H20-H5 TaxID=3046309 RepID=UPI002DB7C9EC|nr:hypothetical protein [Amycolatopsis sp. H20-H5]MEC3976380.1 hypothetical protein [Amycolatopsis sp. H20-H5]